MGIKGLWSVLGDGEVVSLARLATDHLTTHGRPLRIAIDAAGWEFKNLNEKQVAAIREKEPRANPVEKAILFRTLRLLQLGIQPLFVFDGPRRPWKHGKPSGGSQKIREDTALMRRVLGTMKVPYHEAPGEAEAQCAKLQLAGVVDAVWSEDGDSLMFGCTTLIRDYREDGKAEAKSTSEVRLHKADRILRDYGLDQWGLILFAILSGGDYDISGLPGCGSKSALKAAQHGYGRTLCDAETPLARATWRNNLADFFQSGAGHRFSLDVPGYFPRDLVLKNYKFPVVASPEQLESFTDQVSHRWDREIDELKLRDLLATKFNLQDAGYSRHIEPIFFVRSLMQIKPEQRASNNCYKVTVVKQRNVDPATSLTLKVRFLPRQAMHFGYSDPDEAKDKVEVETLQCILHQGLLESVLDTTKGKKPRKRLARGDADAPRGVPAKAPRKRKSSTDDAEDGPEPKRKGSKKLADNDGRKAKAAKQTVPQQSRSKSSSYEDLTLDSDNDNLPPISSFKSSRGNGHSPSVPKPSAIAPSKRSPLSTSSTNTLPPHLIAPKRGQTSKAGAIHTLNDRPNFEDDGEGELDTLPPLREMLRHPTPDGPVNVSAFAGPGRKLGVMPSIAQPKPRMHHQASRKQAAFVDLT